MMLVPLILLIVPVVVHAVNPVVPPVQTPQLSIVAVPFNTFAQS